MGILHGINLGELMSVFFYAWCKPFFCFIPSATQDKYTLVGLLQHNKIGIALSTAIPSWTLESQYIPTWKESVRIVESNS